MNLWSGWVRLQRLDQEHSRKTNKDLLIHVVFEARNRQKQFRFNDRNSQDLDTRDNDRYVYKYTLI